MSFFIYSCLITFSIFLTLSSSSMIMIWIAMEISILGLTPLLVKFKTANSNESTLKYFLIQISAGLIFLGAIVIPNYMIYLMMTSLFIKLGMFPFYFWVPHIFSGLPFPSIFIISTIQKFPPLMAMMNFSSNYLNIFIIFTILTGSIGALYLTNFKKMLAFSSISHTGWVVALTKFSQSWLIYMLVYSMISMSVLFYLNMFYMKSISQTLFMNSTLKNFSFWLLILSLAGLPPLTGFFLKWMTLTFLSNYWGINLWFLIIIFSISLYFYVSMVIISSLQINNFKSHQMSNFNILLILFNFLGLFMFSILFY